MGFLSDVGNMWGGGKTSQGASVWAGQEPFLKDMYQRAQDVSQSNSGQQFAQQFQNPAFQAFQQMAGGGAQTNTGALQNIAQGQTGMQQFQNQQNPALNNAINTGLDQMSQNFQRNIMPGINTGSALSNTSGGSRQGVAQALAANDANSQASNFINQMQSQNFNQMQGRNLQAQNMGNQAQMQAFQGLNQFNQASNTAQANAMGQAPSLSNLGFGSQYGNLQNLSGILGGPTVLGGGSQTDAGFGGFANDMGGMASMFMGG